LSRGSSPSGLGRDLASGRRQPEELVHPAVQLAREQQRHLRRGRGVPLLDGVERLPRQLRAPGQLLLREAGLLPLLPE
jgi:hypothetical protein